MKLKLFLSVVVLLVLTACEPSRPATPTAYYVTESHCSTQEDRARLAQFIVDCGKAANPMSDEEGEDLIAQCERTGKDAMCPVHHHRKVTLDYQTVTIEVKELPAHLR